MRLRLRCPKGTFTIGSTVEPFSSLDVLQLEIESVSDIRASEQILKCGVPPKVIDVDALGGASNVTIEATGIKNGDQITVESKSKNGSGVQTSGNGLTDANDEEFVPAEGGYVTARIMKDDNSCMFHAIAYLLEKDADQHEKYREIVARYVLAHQSQYNEAMLGRTPADYSSWIMKRTSWGGGIELNIFSEYFKVIIHSIDITTVRVDSFGQDKNYESEIILFYSGIHYDAVVFTLFKSKDTSYDRTKFTENAQCVLQAATTLAQIWHRKKKFTDVARFSLKCGVCGASFHGENEAQAHAQQTGHAKFTEY